MTDMTPREIALKCAEICERDLVNRPSDPPANYFDGGLRHCAAEIRAYADTLPDDGVFVPREPTKEMLKDGGYWWYATLHNAHPQERNAAIIYAAMLAAAPKKNGNG